MRCTQIIGLTEKAQQYINENVQQVPSNPCPHCGKPTQTRMAQNVYASAADTGMFDDGPELHEYILCSGKKVKEIVQAVEWFSGPCIFLCLEDESKVKLFEWSEKEIQNV